MVNVLTFEKRDGKGRLIGREAHIDAGQEVVTQEIASDGRTASVQRRPYTPAPIIEGVAQRAAEATQVPE